ncbi:MAG TPA: ATP-binding protein [Thermodesulfobacteriota bacterium]|nr:ATP-binding protein [Thermodesulfobacteriota bacterium]
MKNLFVDARGYLSRRSKPFLILSAFILLLLVGGVDYLTGAELSISIFYLIPISLSVLFVNRRVGVLLSVFSSAMGLTTDLMVGHPYSHLIIVYWNNAVQFGFFLIIVFILSALKMEYEKTVKINTGLQDTLLELRKTQDQLESKAQDLARSNAELEQFAYVAAHDLRQPLIVAGGYINRLGRLYKDKLDPNADRFIGYASDAIARMEGLVNALLAYARVGTKAKDLKVTDYNEIVECATTNLQVEIEKSRAIVTHDQLPALLADHIQLIQLFQNLIGNSIKFRREERPHVHISAEHKEKEWVISITDNGIGIDPKHSTSIFDIFQRVHDSSKYPGNGIGLANCKKIVENHGGRIWVESTPGKGSTFKFAIPIR